MQGRLDFSLRRSIHECYNCGTCGSPFSFAWRRSPRVSVRGDALALVAEGVLTQAVQYTDTLHFICVCVLLCIAAAADFRLGMSRTTGTMNNKPRGPLPRFPKIHKYRTNVGTYSDSHLSSDTLLTT